MNSLFSNTITASRKTRSLGSINAEYLFLSVSKRTLDSCITELGNHLPELVRCVVSQPSSSKRPEVFRDDLLSFVGFQSVFWNEYFCTNRLAQECYSTDTTTAYGSPNISNYLVLGYVNGVQVWRLRQSILPSTRINTSFPLCLPTTERIVGFRTLCPVITVQLLPDLPQSFSTSSSVTTPSLLPYSHQQQYCRLAVAQHRSDSCSVVDIFSASIGANVHVLQQPWPVVRLASSLSWGGYHSSQWIGTLVVATTQQVYMITVITNTFSLLSIVLVAKLVLIRPPCCFFLLTTSLQIRVYDTTTYELRFTIGDFRSVLLPPLWRWLTSESSMDMMPFTHHSAANNVTTLEDPPRVRSSGPIFTVGARWIVYQTAAPLTRTDSEVHLNSLTPPTDAADSQPLSQSGVQRGASNGHVSDATGKGTSINWMGPAATAWKKLISSSPSMTRLLSERIPRAVDLFLDQSGSAASFFPAVEDHFGRDHSIPILHQHQSALNVQLVGGPIVILDLITGEVVGQANIGMNSNTDASTNKKRSSHSGSTNRCMSHSGHHAVTASTFGSSPISEVRDGTWWLSHLENPINVDSSSQRNCLCYSRRARRNYVVCDVHLQSNQCTAPIISHMSLDSSGTSLFCTEWSGRITWVVRLTAAVEQQRGPSLIHGDKRISGVPVYELLRGHTIGSIVDVVASCNLIGNSLVMVI